MASKQEYEGVAFTAMVHAEDGELINATERAEASLDAYKNLRATIAEMKKDGFVPFVSYYNKAEGQQAQPESKYPPSPQEPVSVLAQAEQLGGVVVDQYPITPDESASIASGVRIADGTNYLGMQTRKPNAPDVKVNDSFEIVVDAYKRPTRDKVEFYNAHSEYPAAVQNLKGKGGEIFLDLFPGWTPEVGSEGSIEPLKLYIVGAGSTPPPHNNAYQNIKSVEPA